MAQMRPSRRGFRLAGLRRAEAVLASAKLELRSGVAGPAAQAGARRRNGLDRWMSIALRPFRRRIARANRETELTPNSLKGL
jgi:hypothetical protein